MDRLKYEDEKLIEEVLLLKKVGVMMKGLEGLLGIGENIEVWMFKNFGRSRIGIFREVKLGFNIIIEYLYKLNWKNVLVFNMKCFINLVKY